MVGRPNGVLEFVLDPLGVMTLAYVAQSNVDRFTVQFVCKEELWGDVLCPITPDIALFNLSNTCSVVFVYDCGRWLPHLNVSSQS